jgi:hypothetical protein
MALRRSKDLDDQDYVTAVGKGLDKAFKPRPRPWARRRSARQHVSASVEASDLKLVVFSDLHRGTRDPADDFRRSHRAYRAALGWYLENGYELWLLGDIEELWENGKKDVLQKYDAVLKLEQEFLPPKGPGLRRFYGNHDLDWNKASRVKDHLGQFIGGTSVIESLRLHVRENGQDLGLVFFLHGHQGTPGSDTYAVVSRLAVRWIWRAVQLSQGWIATTPAESNDIRSKHDAAMLAWAQERAKKEPPGQRPILVAGHTHHPVFPGKPPERPTSDEVAEIQAELDMSQDVAQRPRIRAHLELTAARVWEEHYDVPAIDPPCYFNTGCGSFPDGDVTCLEFNGEPYHSEDRNDPRGKVRLMRWLDNDGMPLPRELAAAPLRETLAAVNGSA